MPTLLTLRITEKPEYKQERQAFSVGKKQKSYDLIFCTYGSLSVFTKFYLSMIPFLYFLRVMPGSKHLRHLYSRISPFTNCHSIISSNVSSNITC